MHTSRLACTPGMAALSSSNRPAMTGRIPCRAKGHEGELCCSPLIGQENGVGRPARLQPIDRAFQCCPHWTLGTPSGWPKAMTSDLNRRRPRRRQPLASIMACVSAAWVTYQATRRRPPYQPFRFGVQGVLGATITLLIANQAPGQDAPRSMVLQRMTTSGESMVGLTARMMAPNGVTRGPQPLPAARPRPCRRWGREP
jgi:hypothetical protein